MTWQPISTAPKPERGRRKVIDVWCVTDDRASAEFYFGATMAGVKDRMMWQGRVSEVYWRDGAWRPANGLRLHGLTVTPTHWMDLPLLPAPEDSRMSESGSIPDGSAVLGVVVAARVEVARGATLKDFLALAEVAWGRARADDGSTPEHPRLDGTYGYPQ